MSIPDQVEEVRKEFCQAEAVLMGELAALSFRH